LKNIVILIKQWFKKLLLLKFRAFFYASWIDDIQVHAKNHNFKKRLWRLRFVNPYLLQDQSPCKRQLEVWTSSYDVNFYCDFWNFFWRNGNLLVLRGYNFFIHQIFRKRLCCPKHLFSCLGNYKSLGEGTCEMLEMTWIKHRGQIKHSYNNRNKVRVFSS
jgi:hypothetical protein